MGAKVDTTGIEEYFIETPVRNGRVRARKAVKPAKQAKNGLQSYSSWQLVKELLRRHNMNLQVIGFWLALAFIVWSKLR